MAGLAPNVVLEPGRPYAAFASAPTNALGRALQRGMMDQLEQGFDGAVVELRPCDASVTAIPCESGRWFVYVSGWSTRRRTVSEFWHGLAVAGLADNESTFTVKSLEGKAPVNPTPRSGLERAGDTLYEAGENVVTGVGDVVVGASDVVRGAGGVARDVGVGIRGIGEAASGSGGAFGTVVILAALGFFGWYLYEVGPAGVVKGFK